MNSILLLLVSLLNSLIMAQFQLNCYDNIRLNNLVPFNVNVSLVSVADFGIYPSEPIAYDSKGKGYTSSHLSISSLSRDICLYSFKQYFIGGSGALFQASHFNKQWKVLPMNQVIFDFNVNGKMPPMRDKEAAFWNRYISRFAWNLNNYTVHHTVAALRMPLDHIFNHISFQAIPMIGAVYVFYPLLWDRLIFHCSQYTAIILELSGVSSERIIVEQPVFAHQVVMPWVPNWIPHHTASLKGIAKSFCEVLSKGVLALTFEESIIKIVTALTVTSPSHTSASIEDLLSPTDPYRYIVYSSRKGQHERDVRNETELLDMISKYINKSKYRLVVVGNTPSSNDPKVIQATWQRYAKVYSKAIIMLGPHGSTFNNMIFTPSDCHMIEFNYLPVNHDDFDVRDYNNIAFHAKGSSGRFYNIEPSGIEKEFYFDRYMNISQRSVLNTLIQINKDIPNHDLLIDHINAMDVPDLEVTLKPIVVSTVHKPKPKPRRELPKPLRVNTPH